MLCKYCHLKTHYIDKCPTIICKTCKDVGHPQWLCKNKKPIINNMNNISKKYCFTDEIKKKPENPTLQVQKTLNYYLKLKDELWGNLAE